MGKRSDDSFTVGSYTVFKSKKTDFYYIRFRRGVERSLGTKNKANARKEAEEIVKAEHVRKIAELSRIDRITFHEFKENYISGRRNEFSKDTIDMDRTALSMFENSVGSDTMMALLSSEHIAKFKKDCLARGVKQVSVNSYLRHIKTALKKAHKAGYIKKPVDVPFIKTGKKLPRILTRKEREAILAYAEEHDPDMWRVITFNLWTGCRRAEIRNAKWQNYDDGMLLITGKGDKERYVPVLPEAEKAMGRKLDIGPIFPQWNVDTYTHRFKKIAMKCGISDVSLHKLRHSAATSMLENGISIKIVKEILGHADLSTTEIYTQVKNKLLMDEIRKLKY